ncbi:DEAD/DEAH box helicase [Pseudonocardiaceae bacterium YIM PH 21723]|nr:DEAD/DEAH box helicase [Pseudonocardiaceae bacterium YIM PH 21723]
MNSRWSDTAPFLSAHNSAGPVRLNGAAPSRRPPAGQAISERFSLSTDQTVVGARTNNPHADKALLQRKPRLKKPSAPQQVENVPAPVVETEAPAPAVPTDVPSFVDLGVPQKVADALTREGIIAPFPIQAATLPDSLKGRDVLGRGRTGSGKTLAFGLALLCRLAGGKAQPWHPRGMVLVPTRELATQVDEALKPYARALGLSTKVMVGGVAYSRQEAALRRGVDLIIATPGRLIDHVQQGTCHLNEVMICALDEADQMADMGFMPQVRQLMDLVKPGGQRLLFSATLDKDVDKLVQRYMNNPVTHETEPVSADVPTMEHHLLLVSGGDKQDVVATIAARQGRTIMFVRTKHSADRLTKKLRQVGIAAGSLHGGKTQSARTRTLDDFRDGSTPVLVATDVAARGIHVDDVSLVVHVDPPVDPKGYLHRAGRTARAGESGTVVTIVQHDQRRAVQAMTGKAGVKPTSTKVRPGDEALIKLTGAQVPSGIPLREKPADKPRPARSGGASQGGGRPRGRFGNKAGGDRQPGGSGGERRSGGGRDRSEHKPAGAGAPRRSGGAPRRKPQPA